MLVLSRKPNEKVLFANLGITVEVLRIRGKAVSLGIVAPKDVRILRDEIGTPLPNEDSRSTAKADAKPEPATLPKQLRHALRNRLNAAMLGLHLLHRELETGAAEDSEAAVMQVLKELESMDETIAGFVAAEPSTISPIVAPRRVLLVDDSRNESQLLAGYLRTFDYQVDTAFDGIEAVTYLEAHEKPDVVLMDMQMPRLDGPAAIRRIRETPSLDGIRLFAVSGLSAEEAGVEIGPAGADRWFTKPVRLGDLVEEMERDLAKLPSQ